MEIQHLSCLLPLFLFTESVQNLLSCYIYGCWRSKSIWSKSIYFFKTTSFYHLYEVGWYCIQTMSWNSTFYSCSTTKFVLCGINMLNTSPKCNVLGGTAVFYENIFYNCLIIHIGCMVMCSQWVYLSVNNLFSTATTLLKSIYGLNFRRILSRTIQ